MANEEEGKQSTDTRWELLTTMKADMTKHQLRLLPHVGHTAYDAANDVDDADDRDNNNRARGCGSEFRLTGECGRTRQQLPQ